ncbi:hypothetical protein D3C78_1060420 [compost metagenome]
MNGQHDLTDFILGLPLELLQEVRHFRCLACQFLAADAVDGFCCAIHAFGVFKELEFPLGEHPVRHPAGDGDRLLLGIGAAQFCGHRRAGTGLEFVAAEVVVLDGLIGLEHDPGAGVDADDLVLEAVVALEVGQGVGLDVVGDDQADLGILEVRAVIDDVIFVLAPVIAMGYRQPGRHHRVELELALTYSGTINPILASLKLGP